MDDGGNINNVLTPEALLASLPATAAIMNSVGADSTTAQLAKDVPLEKHAKEVPDNESEALPGTFPETPADELNKPVGINPLPAAAGGLNPIKLAPGEPVPKDLQTADLNSNVKLDKESYEKSDALPGVDQSALNVPPVTGTMIPESSLPMGNGSATINSVSADSTTAALAAQVPKEPKVPEVVKESQDNAGLEPEASAAATEEKQEVEDELKEKVPEAPSTSEGTAGKGTEKSEGDKTLLETAAATAAGVGATAAAVAYAAKDKAVEQAGQLPDSVKEQLPTAVQDTIAAHPTNQETKIEQVSPEVPGEVKESIAEAGKSPEAAGNTAAVEDKKTVEAELLKEVKPVEPASDGTKTEEPAKAAEPVSQTETPSTAAQEAPQVVEPPAPAKDVPENSAAANGANGATSNGGEPSSPTTPAKSTKTGEATTPGSTKSDQKKKNRVSGFFGKLKAKISHKEGN